MFLPYVEGCYLPVYYCGSGIAVCGSVLVLKVIQNIEYFPGVRSIFAAGQASIVVSRDVFSQASIVEYELLPCSGNDRRI